mmetsp:Transcript_9348/g.20905  ORF Transcript_9348/g.20905 Transcript_9348/m.20905 type:complete len:228 (+) Transcript_9348:923-1606(+)
MQQSTTADHRSGRREQRAGCSSCGGGGAAGVAASESSPLPPLRALFGSDSASSKGGARGWSGRPVAMARLRCSVRMQGQIGFLFSRGRVSFRETEPTTKAKTASMAYVRLGSRNGYVSKMVSAKMLGMLSAGLDKCPPRSGPKMRPQEKQSARKLNPCASLPGSITSPRYALETPTLPQKKPSKALAKNACPRVVAVPIRMGATAEPAIPISKVGLRPILSASEPHM